MHHRRVFSASGGSRPEVQSAGATPPECEGIDIPARFLSCRSHAARGGGQRPLGQEGAVWLSIPWAGAYSPHPALRPHPARRPRRRRGRPATACSSAPATSAARRPASSRGCRSGCGAAQDRARHPRGDGRASARTRCTSRRCCRASPTRPPAGGRSTATASSACRTARAPTTCSRPRTRRSSRCS